MTQLMQDYYSFETAENIVIASMAIDNSFYHANRYTIVPDLFTNSTAQAIVKHFAEHADAKITAYDLRLAGLVTDEWMDYVRSTSDHNINNSINALNSLIKLKNRRKLRDSIQKFAGLNLNTTDLEIETEKLIAEISNIIKEHNDAKRAVIDNVAFLDIVQKIFTSDIEVLPTFIGDIDDRLQLQRNNLVVLGGNAGSAKTYIALNMYHNSIQKGYNSIFFTTEMSQEQIAKRLVGIYTDSDLSKSRDLTYQQLDDIMINIATSKHNIVNIERLRISDVRKHLIGLQERQGKVDYVFIDYLTRMEVPKIYRDYRLNVGYLAKELKTMCKEFDCVIVLVAQLSRNNFNRHNKRPMISDLAESADIEREADVIMLNYREEYFLAQANKTIPESIKGVIEINISKNRHGESFKELVLFSKSGRVQNLSIDSKCDYARELRNNNNLNT